MLEFGILILVCIWSLVFDAYMFQILYLYWFWRHEEHICPLIPDWGIGGSWRLLNGVLNLDHNLDNVTGFWYTPILNFGSLSWFWSCEEHPCPFNPDWGFGGCWWFLTGVWHLGFVLDMAMVFDTPMLQILALFLNNKGAKTIHVL